MPALRTSRRTAPRRPLALAAILAAGVGASGCASRQAASPPAAGTAVSQVPGPEPVATVAGHPLAALAGERVLVLPVQRTRAADSAQAGRLPAPGALDTAIALAVGERGVNWAFAADVIRSARRNPTFAADPRRLAVGPLLPGRKITDDGAIADPLASQLRTLVALNDARYALVPAELRLEGGAGGAARPVLRVALVDARGAQLRWFGDVAADPAPGGGDAGAATASLARRFADLIAAP